MKQSAYLRYFILVAAVLSQTIKPSEPSCPPGCSHSHPHESSSSSTPHVNISHLLSTRPSIVSGPYLHPTTGAEVNPMAMMPFGGAMPLPLPFMMPPQDPLKDAEDAVRAQETRRDQIAREAVARRGTPEAALADDQAEIARYQRGRSHMVALYPDVEAAARIDRDHARRIMAINTEPLSAADYALRAAYNHEMGGLSAAMQAPMMNLQTKHFILQQIGVAVGMKAVNVAADYVNDWRKARAAQSRADGKPVILTPGIKADILNGYIATVKGQHDLALLQQTALQNTQLESEILKKNGEVIADMEKLMPTDKAAATALQPLLLNTKAAHFIRVHNHFAPIQAPAKLAAKADAEPAPAETSSKLVTEPAACGPECTGHHH